MKTEIISVELPEDLVKMAKEKGIDEKKVSEILKSFAILELTAISSKLNDRSVEGISKSLKASAWKRTKQKLKI